MKRKRLEKALRPLVEWFDAGSTVNVIQVPHWHCTNALAPTYVKIAVVFFPLGPQGGLPTLEGAYYAERLFTELSSLQEEQDSLSPDCADGIINASYIGSAFDRARVPARRSTRRG